MDWWVGCLTTLSFLYSCGQNQASNSYFKARSQNYALGSQKPKKIDLKTIAFREFCLNLLFSYFWVTYNIVKLQTCSSLHCGVIATLTLSLLSKSVVT